MGGSGGGHTPCVGAHGDGLDQTRTAHLYRTAQALTAALTPADVAAVVFDHALVELRASTAGLWLVADEVIVFAGGAGHTDDSPERVGPIDLGSELPAAVCVRTGQPVTYGSRSERDARWPSLVGLGRSSESVAVLPLVARGETLGCLHIGYASAMPVEEMDLPLLERVAELCAAALDRAQLYERERTRREQIEFLADATRVLTGSLETTDVVHALVDAAVPRLAEWCAVLVPDRDELRTLAVRIEGDADGTEAAAVRDQRFPLDGEFLVCRCYQSGEAILADPLPATTTANLHDATADAIRRVGVRSALILPIEFGGQPIGVLSLGSAEAGMFSSRELRSTAEGLALRAGVALHNADVYDAERTVARTLTRALLPSHTPEIPGYELAIAYLPAAGTVAGDWYEVADVGDRFLIGVGDAAGHGLPAATLMAELRNGARALAAAGERPAQILEHLSKLAAAGDDETFATAVYATLDPRRHHVQWAVAGHPPPILVRDGAAVPLRDPAAGAIAAESPLAWGAEPGRVDHERDVAPNDALVFVTDGVVERRGSDLTTGLAGLTALLEDNTDNSPAALVDRIVNELCAGAGDDCCVLVLRRDPEPRQSPG